MTDAIRAEHTPGPWMATPSGPKMAFFQPFAIGNPVQLVAGAFEDVTGGLLQAGANASLIAAAPEMLAALKVIAFMAGPYTEITAIALDAIAKARGERP
jgi:hypothetical protein